MVKTPKHDTIVQYISPCTMLAIFRTHDVISRMQYPYKYFTDFNKRCRYEVPFLCEIFNPIKNKHLLDIACGPGHHAHALAHYGACITGIDTDKEYLVYARQEAGKYNLTIKYKVLSMIDIHSLRQYYDGAFFVGNPLSILESQSAITATFHGLHSVLKSDSLIVVHAYNYPVYFSDSNSFSFPTLCGNENGTPWRAEQKIIKTENALVHSFILNRQTADGRWESEKHIIPIFAIPIQTILHIMHTAGFTDIHRYGSFTKEAFNESSSPEIIIIARKI